MTTKELVEAVARATEREPLGHATGAAVDALATRTLALEAELVEAKARALEEAAEAMERDLLVVGGFGLGPRFLRSRAADVRAER